MSDIEATETKNLLIAAIGPMFQACGNSYINAWLEDWLRSIAPITGYPGPFIGNIVDVLPDVHDWIEVNEGEWGNIDELTAVKAYKEKREACNG